MSEKIALYGMSGSGNCYKPALLMRQLKCAFEWHEVSPQAGETQTPEFLEINPNGKVPVLSTAHGILSESNAMLCYLADASPLFPDDRWRRAKIMQWLFFEQYSHEPYIATVRYWIHFLDKREEWQDKIAEARTKGEKALSVMNTQLDKTRFLAGDHYSIADIALYAYTHVAHQGDYGLSAFPSVERWLKEVESTDGFIVMADACASSA